MHNFNLVDRLPTSLSCGPQIRLNEIPCTPSLYVYVWPNPWTPGWEPPNYTINKQLNTDLYNTVEPL